MQLALVPGASGRWQARNPSGHQPQQRIRRGGIAASAIARGRCRDAFAALLAVGRGPADCQLRAAARRGDGEIHVGKAHIASDPSTSLLADPGDCSLERESAGGKGAGGRAGCSVVAERVKQTTTGAEPGRERQRKSQAAKEEHPELSGGDGDCFVSRAD